MGVKKTLIGGISKKRERDTEIDSKIIKKRQPDKILGSANRKKKVEFLIKRASKGVG